MPKHKPKPFDVDRFAAEVQAAHRRLVRLMPDSDPGDLLLIAQSLLRPFGTGKVFFLRPGKNGGHVF